MFYLPFWFIVYALGLKLRKKAPQLPPTELSNYLCRTVLFVGVSAMTTIIFFTFESLSYAASDGLEGYRATTYRQQQCSPRAT